LVKSSSRAATIDAITECDGNCTATMSLYCGKADELAGLQARVRELVDEGEVSLFLQRPLTL